MTKHQIAGGAALSWLHPKDETRYLNLIKSRLGKMVDAEVLQNFQTRGWAEGVAKRSVLTRAGESRLAELEQALGARAEASQP